ncbi:MAG: hypothetical protein L6Q99_11980 [Planctomycetes bacterium]|nr:hypothetical protein [Planctomycetota bacterium]
MDDALQEPRVYELDLDRLETDRTSPWTAFARSESAVPERLRRLARVGGEASALVELARREDAFVLAVGDAVRRGVPTASRATVVARSPLSGLVADGQVGSDVARRLASVADVVVLVGRARANVLVLGVDGVKLVEIPELARREPRDAHAFVEARLGPCATLSIGRAGERGVRIANLAACSSGSGAAALAHYVGRGGLGAAFGAHGLKLVAVAAPAIETAVDPELVRWLLGSPRLAARATGGTFELSESYAARGDLFARGGTLALDRDAARAFGREIEAHAKAQHGCRGCPTPCGLVLEGARGEKRSVRFSAGHALGLNLGLERGEDALRLLAACDAAGLDAKELGSALALVARAREAGLVADGPRFGELDGFLELVARTADVRGTGELLGRGSAAVAERFGFEARVARGQTVRREQSRASLLGQCVAARGPEPMRTFPFLATDASSRVRLERLIAPLALPLGAEDPESSVGKGRLVWWHENLSAALDATGFCAFSAGALLVDGTVTLDELASAILPSAWRTDRREPLGWTLLELGARVVELVRALERRFGAPDDVDRPAFARDELQRPGMLDEYLALRSSESAATALERASRPRWGVASRPVEDALGPAVAVRGVGGASDAPSQARSGASTVARGRGVVSVVSGGTLAASYGRERELALDLPCDVAHVLAALEATTPAGAPLFAGGLPIPAVFRAGRRLEPNSSVADGDRLDLVLAISGG